jgi:ABC-type multidrug transport system ATPase subunit/multidrug efflux pump subunit AcrB
VRRTARAIAALAVMLLAVVAAPRLALDYAPRGASSEIVASIHFATATAGDPVDVTNRWVIPMEAAIRSLGDVTATRGEVGGDGATIVVRFRRGIDAELKAARLLSELAPLRAKLPENASIDVWPSADSGSRPSAIFAISAPDVSRVAERVADALRATAGVREVEAFGATRDVVDVRAFAEAPGLGAEILRALSPRVIGHSPFAGREVSVVSAAQASRVRDVRIGGQRLDAIAAIRERAEEPRMVARVEGRGAVVLQIVRDDDVSLFAFDRGVRATLHAANVKTLELSSDAGELRALLLRSAIAALLAMIVLAFAGARVAGRKGIALAAYVPLAIAVMINICRIFALRVDALGIAAALIAVAGLAPVAAWRMLDDRRAARWPVVVAFLFAILPLVAISLASSALTAVLVVPARVFAVAAIASLIAIVILPRMPHAVEASGRGERRLMRASFAIVLAAVATATFLLSWFGRNLDPREAQQVPNRDRLFVRLSMPAGTPLAPTINALAQVERSMRGIDGFTRIWSYASAGRGTVVADVAGRFQRQEAFDLLQLRVRAAMPFPRAMVRIDRAFDRGASAREDALEEKPEADDRGYVYRVLLKGPDANALRRTLDQIVTRLGRLTFHRDSIVAAWPAATTQITLVPRPGVTPAIAAQLARQLSTRTLPPSPRVLPDGRLLVAADANAPRRDDEVPRAADLFAVPMPQTVESAFEVRAEPVSGRVTRELGRFVMPISIGVPGYSVEAKTDNRKNADRTLSLMSVPAGVVLDRPALGAVTFSIEKLRLFGLAALLPSMMFALAAVVLSSLRRALIALAPALVGIACTSPALLAADAPMDELVLLATAAAACCVTAAATIALVRFRSVAATYRELRRALSVVAVAAIAGGVMLGVAATASAGLGEAWRAPLLAACAVLITGGAPSMLLPSAIESVARRRERVVVPAVWTPAVLEVQNVTKVYASGFRALHRVSFNLQPGIVGLLGPNGAGKTTLLRIVTGLLLPTRGVIRFGGVEVRPSTLAAYRTQIGFLPQEFNAYSGLTAAQFLDYWALERGVSDAAKRRSEVERLLVVARLEKHGGRKLRDFSGGMRQRIGIARAIIGDPPLLVVDEPTTGLDIEARAHFRALISGLAGDRIIILSTHIASDVESTASRLLLLARGRLCWDGSPEALIVRARGRVFEAVVDDHEARQLTRRYRITTRIRQANGIRMRGIVIAGEALPATEVAPTLEEAYLAEIAPASLTRGASFAFVYE